MVSHTSVLRYANTDKTLPQIAQELGVDAVIEGAVQRSADRVRITAQLIYAPKDTNLWARTYDRDLSDVLALQSTVAKEIADEIRVNMTPGETVRLTKPRTVNPEALQAYWKGRYYLASANRNSYGKDKDKAAQAGGDTPSCCVLRRGDSTRSELCPSLYGIFGFTGLLSGRLGPRPPPSHSSG